MAIKDQAIGAAVGVVVTAVLGVIGAAAFGDGGLIRVLNGATKLEHGEVMARVAALEEILNNLGASDRTIENLQDRLVSVSNIEANAEAAAGQFISLATTLEQEAEGQLGQARSRIDQLNAALRGAEAITQLSEESIGAFEAILRGNPDVLQAAISGVVAIPRGGVIAINGSACPDGWSPVQNGAGRTIVGAGQGAGLTLRRLGQIGGEERVALSPSEMPPHSHAIGPVWGNPLPNRDVPAWNVTGTAAVFTRYAETQPAGAGQAHNNMPPFIALHFCEFVGTSQ